MKQKQSFSIIGMHCAGCAAGIQKSLNEMDGIVNAEVNYATASAEVEFDPKKVSIKDMEQAVEKLGFKMITDTEDEEQGDTLRHLEYTELKRNTIGAIILTIPVFITGMFFMDFKYANNIMLIFTLPVVFIFGRSFFINAFRQIKHGKVNMDTLVALSTGISFLFSFFNSLFPEFWSKAGLHVHVYYEASAMIISLVLLGRFLEGRAKSRTSDSIKKLMGLQPKEVTKLNENGTEQVVSVKSLNIGDIIIVKPGDKIAVDGVVISGDSYVDESSITGEPMPAHKVEGQRVFSGSVNQKGSFNLLAEKVGKETLLAQIIKTVKSAQGSKAPVQRYVDKVASVFVPVVIGISMITFVMWMIFGGENAFAYALLTAVTVLVIACPCALGLATPTAIMVGIGKAAEYNILVKDAESLELAHKVDVIILDKTGTLTEGKPRVTEIHEIDTTEEDLSVLLSMEALSEHPVAGAIVEYLKEKDIRKVDGIGFESITGKGIAAKYNGSDYVAGNLEVINNNGIPLSDETEVKIAEFTDNYYTVVIFARNKKIIMLLAIVDKVRESSSGVVERLKSKGIEVCMITGDNEKTAAKVASQTGITYFRAKALPSDKLKFVKDFQAQGKKVAVVGDGINDSEALAQADISIAMGQGADIAMDVAQVTLMGSHLESLPQLIYISAHTVRKIKQNLFWAFIYNTIGIPVAAGVLYPVFGILLNPMIAAAAMVMSSISVVLNSIIWRKIYD